VEVEVLY